MYSKVVGLKQRFIRICYLVNSNLEDKNLDKLFRYNSTVMGGQRNIFVYTDGSKIDSIWEKNILSFDPDIIFIVGLVRIEVVEKLKNKVQPFYIYEWEFNQDSEFIDNQFISVIDLFKEQQKNPISPQISLYYLPHYTANKY